MVRKGYRMVRKGSKQLECLDKYEIEIEEEIEIEKGSEK